MNLVNRLTLIPSQSPWVRYRKLMVCDIKDNIVTSETRKWVDKQQDGFRIAYAI